MNGTGLGYRRVLVGFALAAAGAVLMVLACNTTVVGNSDGQGGTLDRGSVKDGVLPDAPADGPPVCSGGLDNDNDGYGIGCPAGADCDDTDPLTHPGAKEVCDGKDNNCNNRVDEGVKNRCGTCDPGCKGFATGTPFPVNKTSDPNLKDINGVGLDGNGDLVLQKTRKNFNYMWIANTFDIMGYKTGCHYANQSGYNPANNARCRGSISKVDTTQMKEVARYFTTTCKSRPGATSCVDLHGKPITAAFPHAPSRTAVDYNFDVWVANRGFSGQPSATKIANALSDCKDRNGNKVIDTSADRNGDGKITVDCDGDGMPDSLSTVCTGTLAGKKPEFLGDDDECVLFTVNYGDPASSSNKLGDIGRSVCLDAGGHAGGASNAWVGTFYHTSTGNNRYFRIDGTTGKLSGPFPLKSGHFAYGCVVDSQGILWSVDTRGTLTYLNTVNPISQVGAILRPVGPSRVRFYGIAVDGKNNIWMGGYSSYMVYRYRPVRTSWSTLSTGKWTWIKQPPACLHSRGIAADNRGKVWVAINNGYILRINQNIGDGAQDQSGSTSYWPVKGLTIIGVGVDFTGNVWAVSFDDHVASHLDVDAKGDPVLPATGQTKTVSVGQNPYTYSDFTGYGLQNFTRPQGRYLYQLQACNNGKKARWSQVSWKTTTPPGTEVRLRVRSGNTATSMGSWVGPFKTSPAPLGKTAASPLSPNPAVYLQVEFTLITNKPKLSPILHEFSFAFDCTGTPG